MSQLEQLNSALAGRYAIDRLIGEGGMATVYLARDLRHHRKVALKVLRPDLGAVLGLERFESEIKVTANLQHPNLLPLFDSGAADSLLFYVMPFVEGESLRARLEREKQLPVDESVRIATAVGSALDYAHRHGVIHRDLKPENILLHDGQPLVADFGIALAVSNAGGSRVTQTGVSLGTPQYMSPEQATGDRAIDARADVYALGAVTYEMLTGEPPHTGTTSQAIIARLMTERPRPIRSSRASVPEQVEAAVERALEKLPADRWATAKEFSEALAGTRIATRTTTTAVAGRGVRSRPAPRELLAWGLAVLGLVAALVGLRPRAPVETGIPAEFDVRLPDSLDPTPVGGASGLDLSADGSTIVFQAQNAGAWPALYVRRMAESFVEKIRGTDSSRSPILSPDGTEVLFSPQGATGNNSVALKRVALRGGVPRVIADSAQGNGQASWGDAGTVVLVHRNRLWTVPEDGGKRTLLAAPDSSRAHRRYGFPDVLPGGKAALFVIWKGGGSLDSATIGVVTIPDGKVTELGLRGTYPRYSTTGHILYAGADGTLNAAPFDAASHRVTGPSALIADNVRVGSGGAASFSPGAGGVVAYLTGGSNRDLGRVWLAVDREGRERDLGILPRFYLTGRLSPDARQLAFIITTDPGFRDPDVWRYDLASRVMTRVTTDSASAYPVWSADGEKLAFAKVPADTVVYWRALYATARNERFFGTADSIRAVVPGPPHTYAVFRVQPGNSRTPDVWVVPLDSLDRPRPLSAEAYIETSPDISSDGRLVAYTTNRTGREEIYVRSVLGGPEVQVSSEGGVEPKWGRQPGELYYRGPRRMMAVRVGERPRLAVLRRDSLFLDTYPRLGVAGNVANYDVFPGGRELLMMQGTRRLDSTPMIRVRLNWDLSRVRARSQEP